METVLPGHERDARRRAERVDIKRLETHTLAGHAVEVWRLVLLVAVAGEFFRAQIVSEDEDDVGLLCVGCVDGPQKTQKTRKEEVNESFHGL